MANVRDSDTSLWLHNKLGTSNDSWTGGSICGQLNAEVLRNIKDCFPDLQTQVKLKLLLSFFHIPRRNIEEWRVELDQIIDVAIGDSELWVSMLAESLKTFPATGSLNTELTDVDEVRPIFTDLVNELRKLVKKQADHVMLPMECHYLNKPALVSVVGQQPAPIKHFTIKKKPKSAILRSDLLQKSHDVASNLKKASAPVIPVRSRGMPRKMTDTTPLKGIPSRVPTSGFRSNALTNTLTNRPPLSRPAAGRKEGGVKLLDISDQPLGFMAAKKRKKMQEMEEKKAVETTGLQNSPPPAVPAPDYAAGLASATTYAPPTPQPAVSRTPTSPSTATVSTTVISQTTQQPSSVVAAPASIVTVIQTTTTAPQYITTSIIRPVPPLLTTTNVTQRTAIVAEQPATAVPVGTPLVISTRPVQHVTQVRIQPPAANTSLQRRGLALTREQMLEAQEMFRAANKVTRPEKALILGFMAGSRDNPCPHLGNIVTIKLSEDQENVQQPDDTYLTMMVETHFQMNYNNGEWKRIRKYRHIEKSVEPIQQNAQAAALV
ncbi:negative elongation factor A [Onthophagus taurus]|uniref:negative elongation factor A n=1 Tax=Onthophagus taurus TaxID=166361 RepID=UPI0039BE4CC1